MVAFLYKLYKSSKVRGVATLSYRYVPTQMSARLNQLLWPWCLLLCNNLTSSKLSKLKKPPKLDNNNILAAKTLKC